MKYRLLYSLCLISAGLSLGARAAVITVTTTNNVNPSPTELSLLQALTNVRDGDEIDFKIPGTGPHYLATPTGGYPLIINKNVTINGYSQAGSTPNSSPILGTNNAKIDIVLDSRSGGYRSMKLTLTAPNDDPGYDETQGAVLGVDGGTGLVVQGLSFLGGPQVGSDGSIALNFISFARGASGHVKGCWLGVDPDGTTVAAAASGITGFRYQGKDATGTVTNELLISGLIIGVSSTSKTPTQDFNVLAGMPVNPIVVEGDNTRITGNFITVLPDGMHDVDVGLDDTLKGRFQGAISIGRSGNSTLIGTDGDGTNDENERNVIGGTVPTALGGADQLINFYSLNPGTNIVIAGNYIGIAIDGKTRFTNGVPVLNASGASAQYRIGSNFDHLSDTLEGNLIANNYPSALFPVSSFQQTPESLNFLSQLPASGAVALRGNALIDNFPFPASPLRNSGTFLSDYYAQALLDTTAGVSPVLTTNSTVTRLRGTVPLADPDKYPATTVDVYIADQEGITNGLAANIPQLPQGFVQGLRYVGSIGENAGSDLNTQRGTFEFDISRFNLPPGTQLTVTANYLSPEGFAQAPSITSITRSQTGITISWVGSGSLQSSPSITDPNWTDEVSDANTFSGPATDAVRFYRLQGTGTGTAGGLPTLTSPFSNVVEVH